jgi:hypothetical protein
MPVDVETVMHEVAAALVEVAPAPPEWPLSETAPVGRVNHRRWVWRGVAAASAIGVVTGGLWLIGDRSADAPTPATTPHTVAPTLPAAGRPTRFPVVGEPGPADRSARGSYSQWSIPDGPKVTALVARRAANTLSDGVAVTAANRFDDSAFGEGEPVTVWGRPATMFTEPGDPVLRAIVVERGGLVLSFYGRDPMTLLDQLTPDSIAVDPTTPAGFGVPFTLRFGSLPAGYEVVAGPEVIPPEGVSVSLSLGSEPDPDFGVIEVAPWSQLFALAAAGDLEAVDINGNEGWLQRGDGNWVAWSTDDGTHVMVGATDTTQQSLDLASQLTLVDEGTWRARYGVDEPDFPERTPSCPAEVGADAEAVRLAPTAIPEDMHLVHCDFGVREAGDDVVERIYATATSNPESGPAFILITLDARYASPDIPNDADRVNVRDVDAFVYPGPIPSSRTVSIGPIDGTWYSITGYNVTRTELLTAATTAAPAPDGYGGTLDPAALPPGVTELAAGTRREAWFMERSAQQHPIGQASWTGDHNDRTFWYTASHQAATFLPSGRIGFETVTDLTVQGHDGYQATTSDGFQTIGWNDGNITVMLGATGLTADELRSIAETMHQANQTEWNAIVATMPSRPVDSPTAPATTTAD